MFSNDWLTKKTPKVLQKKIGTEYLEKRDRRSLSECNTGLHEVFGSEFKGKNIQTIIVQINESKSIPSKLKEIMIDTIKKNGVKNNPVLMNQFEFGHSNFSHDVYKEAVDKNFYHLQAMIMYSLSSWNAYMEMVCDVNREIKMNEYKLIADLTKTNDEERYFINLYHFLEKYGDYSKLKIERSALSLKSNTQSLDEMYRIQNLTIKELKKELKQKSEISLYTVNALIRVFNVLAHYFRHSDSQYLMMSNYDSWWNEVGNSFLDYLMRVTIASNNDRVIHISERLMVGIFASYLTYYYLEGHALNIIENRYKKNPEIQIIIKELINIREGTSSVSNVKKLFDRLGAISREDKLIQKCMNKIIYQDNHYRDYNGWNYMMNWGDAALPEDKNASDSDRKFDLPVDDSEIEFDLSLAEEKDEKISFYHSPQSFWTWTNEKKKGPFFTHLKKGIQKDFIESKDELNQIIGQQLVEVYEDLEKFYKVLTATNIVDYQDDLFELKTRINQITVLIAESDMEPLEIQKWKNALFYISNFITEKLVNLHDKLKETGPSV